MKLIVFQTSSGAALGVVTSGGVVPLDGSAGGDTMTPAALLSEGEPALRRVRAAVERLASGAHLVQETELQIVQQYARGELPICCITAGRDAVRL